MNSILIIDNGEIYNHPKIDNKLLFSFLKNFEGDEDTIIKVTVVRGAKNDH